MAAVVLTQFTPSKASAGGRAGALGLADNEEIFLSLCSAGKASCIDELLTAFMCSYSCAW